MRTISAVEFATIFGTRQGIRTVDLRDWQNGARTTVLSGASLTRCVHREPRRPRRIGSGLLDGRSATALLCCWDGELFQLGINNNTDIP